MTDGLETRDQGLAKLLASLWYLVFTGRLHSRTWHTSTDGAPDRASITLNLAPDD